MTSTLQRIPLVRPSLGDEEAEAAARVVRSGWVTQGPEVEAFERELAAAVGAKHAVAVANCTVALQLALQGLGVERGDEVVTVSHSFVATANAIVNVGARPIFVDVERSTLGMDPGRLQEVMQRKPKAILAVHQIGIPCALERVLEIAAKFRVPVIEDAACAIGSEIDWQGHVERIGRPHGDVACFSFHPRKVVTTGDGGMLTTESDSLARRFRLLRQHAMSVPDTVRHSSSTPVFEEYLEPGYNYRLTDVQAAIGRPQLRRLSGIVDERRRLARRYIEALAENPVLEPPSVPAWALPNWQSFPLFLRDGVNQIDAMQFLLDHGVACKRGISNAHQEPAYAAYGCGVEGCVHVNGRCRRLPVSEALRDGTILIPLFHGMTGAEQDKVIDVCNALGRRQ